MLNPIAFTAEENVKPIKCVCVIGGTGGGPDPCGCAIMQGIGAPACTYPNPS